MRRTRPTFRSFHQFDLCDVFTRWASPQDVQPYDRPRLLQCLHGDGVSDFTHVHVVNEHDAVVHPGDADREAMRTFGGPDPDLRFTLESGSGSGSGRT